MELILDSLLEGARRARGTVIIVDVFRAFTTAAVAFSGGAKQIVLVAEVEEALALRDQGVGEICMGEVGGKRPRGFDFGNSPYDISRADVEGKTIIQSTRAGTVGMEAASHAERLYGGSFAVASATVEVVRRLDPEVVTIVAMGSEGRLSEWTKMSSAVCTCEICSRGGVLTTPASAPSSSRVRSRRSTAIQTCRISPLKIGTWRWTSIHTGSRSGCSTGTDSWWRSRSGSESQPDVVMRLTS